MAAITNIADHEQERIVIDEDSASVSDQFEQEEDDDDEEEDVSLCDLPVNLIKQDKTQLSHPESDTHHVATDTQDQEFDFGSSMRRGSNNLLTYTKMCAADEVFFQGQILPLRPSVSSDTCSNGLTRRCPLSGVGLRSSSCRSRISHNSSFSSSTSSTTTTTGITSKPRGTRPINQFYTEPSPKPQIKIPNSRLETAGSRHHKSSMWDFFRLGLVRTPDMELQDFNKVLRTNSSTSSTRANNNVKNSVSRNSSVSSTNSTNFVSNYNNAASTISGLKSENSKPRKQSFFSNVHGCKCSIETLASNNVIIKSRSSSSRSSSTGHINEGGSGRAAAADLITRAESKEKVAIELKMTMKNNNKKQQQSCKQKEKQTLSHHRTYEWLKQLSHANSPPVHV
ncbi:hypothetical protein TB1_026790 [Malus domestica]